MNDLQEDNFCHFTHGERHFQVSLVKETVQKLSDLRGTLVYDTLQSCWKTFVEVRDFHF